MPMMSSTELAKIGSHINSLETARDREKEKAKKATEINKGLVMLEAWGGAGAFGYLRGLYEDPTTGAWNLPSTTVDLEVIAFLGLAAGAIGGAYFKQTAPYTQHVANVAAGIGGHYFGQIARKVAKTKKFTMIAGVPGIGALPQYSPAGYDATQFSAPYADPVAESLASAGV